MRLRAAAFVLALSIPALADPNEKKPDERKAEQLFGEGESAFNAGDYRRAAASFEAAFRAKEHPAVLWNAGRSWQRAGEELLAANDFSRYLERLPADAPHRDEATRALASMIKALGRVHMLGPPPVELDGAAWSEEAPFVTPGEHVATAKGQRKVFAVRAGETVSVMVDASAAPPPPPPPPPPHEERHEEPRSLVHSPWIVAIGGTLAAVGTGVSIWSGLDTVDRAHAFDASPSKARLDDGDAAQVRTNVLIGVTGAIALVTLGAAVFLADWRGHR